ncbi:hypothetical protein [Frigoribacterium sp. UYMn621]|uniref:hypothetical protein n=1 Tax=Frigoribacterium sp. UYMn621 TaxID=3156343 RepID=UPI00339B238A
MTTVTTTEYTAPLSGLISRIAARFAPAVAKAPAAKAGSTQEIPVEVRAGSLNAAHLNQTIALRDGLRGRITFLEHRTSNDTRGSRVVDVTTDYGTVRTYPAAATVVLLETLPKPVRPAGPSVYVNPDGQSTAEVLVEKAIAKAEADEELAEARIPTLTPRLRTSGILAGMIV